MKCHPLKVQRFIQFNSIQFNKPFLRTTVCKAACQWARYSSSTHSHRLFSLEPLGLIPWKHFPESIAKAILARPCHWKALTRDEKVGIRCHSFLFLEAAKPPRSYKAIRSVGSSSLVNKIFPLYSSHSSNHPPFPAKKKPVLTNPTWFLSEL